MSTKDTIRNLEQAGKVIRFQPHLKPYEVEKRGLFFVPSVHAWIMQEPKKKAAMEYHAAVYSQLTDFVVGKEIDDKHFIKQCIPFSENVWAIGIRFVPHCRIFGAFLGPDCFVGTHRAERKNLDFDKHVLRTNSEWAALFPTIPRFTGTRFHHYVSNGVERDDRKVYS